MLAEKLVSSHRGYPFRRTREFHLFLAQLDVAIVHDLRNDVGTIAEFIGDQIWLAVLHLVHAELLGRIGLDVRELVVVVDRLDIEGRFVRLEL